MTTNTLIITTKEARYVRAEDAANWLTVARSSCGRDRMTASGFDAYASNRSRAELDQARATHEVANWLWTVGLALEGRGAESVDRHLRRAHAMIERLGNDYPELAADIRAEVARVEPHAASTDAMHFPQG